MVSKTNKSNFAKVKKGISLIRTGHFKTFFKTLIKRIYSSKLSLGLRRDMSTEFPHPKAKIDISIRPLKEQDVSLLLSLDGLSEAETRMVEVQRNLINAGFNNCYVAVTGDDTPCYMQLILTPSENSKIRQYFGMLFPTLLEKEALLEGAFMHQTFRGQKVMPDAMHRISQKAREMGADSVITFVTSNNIPSLRGCKSCGFSPYVVRKEKWILFRHYISFQAISPEILVDYNTATN
jgi:hypothetical protein